MLGESYFYEGDFGKAGEKLNRLSRRPEFVNADKVRSCLGKMKEKQQTPAKNRRQSGRAASPFSMTLFKAGRRLTA
jgi:hypothetical protein